MPQHSKHIKTEKNLFILVIVKIEELRIPIYATLSDGFLKLY